MLHSLSSRSSSFILEFNSCWIYYRYLPIYFSFIYIFFQLLVFLAQFCYMFFKCFNLLFHFLFQNLTHILINNKLIIFNLENLPNHFLVNHNQYTSTRTFTYNRSYIANLIFVFFFTNWSI